MNIIIKSIVILDSALKHDVSQQSIIHCLQYFSNDIIIDEEEHKRLFAGFDHLGNAIEVIVIDEEERNRIVVIHAMKLQKKYYFLLERGE